MPDLNDADVTSQLARAESRKWQEFAFKAYARIIARKHNVTVPIIDLAALSDEELERDLGLVRDLAHLPPA
ncbi:hypothetical protein QIL38_gp1 [ssRNA phage Gephyllon.2_5]|uniref:Uncharacterized protein n=2 Tax=Fiersviridae TaxID=2842319 RepID=A0A8S5KYT9_9VIRU|nr:hypothetical protein QIL38_gp1 [ssRNA phage Gephyllon.2_5]QDH86646.1 MAG: hypothetical protein H2BulkLitter11460_000001 [Leviviridae sp.]DAD50356.1 TPA_asm: hypothetical protein [ssRNA phage Gephyllon.2_5]